MNEPATNYVSVNELGRLVEQKTGLTATGHHELSGT